MSRAPALRLVFFAVLLLVVAPSVVAAEPNATGIHGALDPFVHWLLSLSAPDGGYIDPAGLKEFTLPKDIGRPRVLRKDNPPRAASITETGSHGVSSSVTIRATQRPH